MRSQWSRIVALFLTLLVGVGCSTGQHADEELLSSYRVGMSREDVHVLLKDYSLIASASRPVDGWATSGPVDERLARIASRYERDNPGVTVSSAEVYWVGRYTSAPLVAGGVWFDYFLFDSEGRVLAFLRQFAD